MSLPNVVYGNEPETRIYKNPRRSSSRSNHVLLGTWLEVEDAQGDWLKVETAGRGKADG